MPAPSPLVSISNRQRDRRVSIPGLRRWTLLTLRFLKSDAELGIHLVSTAEMTEVNGRFLGHDGSTDVITFDHGSIPGRLHGELYISIADAIDQARSFRTTWQQELGRYVIHGLLHLTGEDDLEPGARRRMKRRENQLFGHVESLIPTASLERPPVLPRRPVPPRHG